MPPTIDRPDAAGQPDAGPDAGVAGCRIEDCPAPPTTAATQCPFRAPDAGLSPSCIADVCVNECNESRSCDVTDGGRCLRCGSSVKCSASACTAGRRCGFAVTRNTCLNLLDDDSRWWVDQASDCLGLISNDAGVVLGTWVDLDVGEALLNIPRLGGYCSGQDLFTGVPRTQVFCPFCSFVLEGCD